MKAFKRSRKQYQSITGMGVRVLASPAVCRLSAGLSTPHNLSLDAVLITQFAHKIAEQEAREQILSSVDEEELTSEARYCLIKIFEKWAWA